MNNICSGANHQKGRTMMIRAYNLFANEMYHLNSMYSSSSTFDLMQTIYIYHPYKVTG